MEKKTRVSDSYNSILRKGPDFATYGTSSRFSSRSSTLCKLLLILKIMSDLREGKSFPKDLSSNMNIMQGKD